VLGKPLGNGHPIGAVITTRAVADRFAEGPEYFSTFGGSTLSCLIAAEVLDIVEDERLAANAKAMGERLLTGLQALGEKYPVIGDVRGLGLFLMKSRRRARSSDGAIAVYSSLMVNRLRDMRILIG
ncbi:aminotransferase class III-fold pyridoxal phosphate-dependent enzyme, partial [Cupriavidus sp. 2MCAB6]|uniref:aminotransferase class III-fold pyridoxal phosphate-dependent enzyme n=1 Tax=Cupriavidus sp. 2MCAB6 TaxID=3232981 RepID=UPI003F93EBDA